MKLWGLKVRGGNLASVALRTRADIQRWAGQRYMGAYDFNQLQPDWKAVWKKVRQNHPDFRIVRVSVSE